jgi:hypothetical protein
MEIIMPDDKVVSLERTPGQHIADGQKMARSIVLEAMQAVFDRLPYGIKFTLSDGSIGSVGKFSPPNMRDGEAQFGFDVRFEEGTSRLDHIEFLVTQSGWCSAPKKEPITIPALTPV